jgi:hypothetical protein
VTRIDPDGVPVAAEGRYRIGTYVEIFNRTFGDVVEGHCPNCHGRLRPSTGYCWECSINWSATATHDGRRIIQVLGDAKLDDQDAVLTWSLGPARPPYADITEAR